jgi:hypothetical protein
MTQSQQLLVILDTTHSRCTFFFLDTLRKKLASYLALYFIAYFTQGKKSHGRRKVVEMIILIRDGRFFASQCTCRFKLRKAVEMIIIWEEVVRLTST